MVGRRSCVPNCTSNYDSTPGYTSVFRFPKIQELKDQWIKKIPRENLVVNKNTVVCVKHFEEGSVITYDVLPTTTGDVKVLRGTPKLKEGAYPTIFPGCPKYMTENKKRERTPTIERIAKMQKLDDDDLEAWLQNDRINDLDTLTSSWPLSSRRPWHSHPT